MNIERSFVFAFKSPKAAQKLAIGTLCTLLFFTVFFAFVTIGYLMRILCSALEGRDETLPEWNDIFGLFQEGLTPGLVMLSYIGPLVGLFLLELIAHQTIGVSQSGTILFALLRFIYYVAITAIVPLAVIRLVVIGSFKSAFQMEPIFDFVKANLALYLQAWGVSLGIGLVVSIAGFVTVGLGSILLGVGSSFLLFVGYAITVHLFAGAYRGARPFSDDREGDIRASVSVPPPLRQVKK